MPNLQWFLQELYSSVGTGISQRRDVVEAMLPYISRELSRGAELKHITRHMLGLFAGQPGARAWRRYLSEHAHRRSAGIEVVRQALTGLPAAA